jgi:hypothetical protein
VGYASYTHIAGTHSVVLNRLVMINLLFGALLLLPVFVSAEVQWEIVSAKYKELTVISKKGFEYKPINPTLEIFAYNAHVYTVDHDNDPISVVTKLISSSVGEDYEVTNSLILKLPLLDQKQKIENERKAKEFSDSVFSGRKIYITGEITIDEYVVLLMESNDALTGEAVFSMPFFLVDTDEGYRIDLQAPAYMATAFMFLFEPDSNIIAFEDSNEYAVIIIPPERKGSFLSDIAGAFK